MNLMLVVGAGLLLMALCFAIAQYIMGNPLKGPSLFIPIWLVASAYSLWDAVSKTDHTYSEQLPVFIVVFLIPTLSSLVIRNKLASSGDA